MEKLTLELTLRKNRKTILESTKNEVIFYNFQLTLAIDHSFIFLQVKTKLLCLLWDKRNTRASCECSSLYDEYWRKKATRAVGTNTSGGLVIINRIT